MSSLTTKSYASRASSHSNPTAKRLLEIMERKKSNLALSIDVTTCKEVLDIVRTVGSSLCMVKVSELSLPLFLDPPPHQIKLRMERNASLFVSVS